MRKLIGVGVVTLGLVFAGSAMANDGASLYKSKCLPCHGAGGAGTAMAPAFTGNAFVKGASKADVAAVIKNGRAGAQKKYKKFALSMPPWKASLKDAEIDAIADYLKTLASK
ncbi:MAG: c-type cytochrome [Thermodesulfobacteriota bacterium]